MPTLNKQQLVFIMVTLNDSGKNTISHFQDAQNIYAGQKAIMH